MSSQTEGSSVSSAWHIFFGINFAWAFALFLRAAFQAVSTYAHNWTDVCTWAYSSVSCGGYFDDLCLTLFPVRQVSTLFFKPDPFHLFNHRFIHRLINLFIDPSIYSTIDSIGSSICSSIHPSILNLWIHTSIHQAVHPFIPSIYPYTHTQIASIFPFISPYACVYFFSQPPFLPLSFLPQGRSWIPRRCSLAPSPSIKWGPIQLAP